MESEIKEVLSGFLKVETSQISNETVIDRTALGNSIMLHRMYAKISQKGFQIADYNTIRTYGQLLDRISGKKTGKSNTETSPHIGSSSISSRPGTQIGLDIESKSNFEVPADFREHSFYQENFTPNEISYCLLQSEPLLSFAGLFAAKEAIIKADNSLIGTPFALIEIQHNLQGQPFFRDFQLSISHTEETVAAVAFRSVPVALPDAKEHNSYLEPPISTHSGKKYNFLAILIAIVSLLFSVFVFLNK